MKADVITMQDIFKFQVDEVAADGTVVGGLRSTGLRMASIGKFERRGIQLPVALFSGVDPQFLAPGAPAA